MQTTFTVTGCTPNQKGGFVWKLNTVVKTEAFGIKKDVKRTFYIGNMPASVEPDTEVKDDLNRFDVVERPFDTVEESTGEQQTIMLKWLHVKVGI